jgi:cytosine/adenosine deaminase-related metal-dependent hydrolase
MIVNNANLVTLWSNEPAIDGALVAIEGKSIVDFGKVGKLVDRYDDTEVLDVSGRLVIPGMIDGHLRVDRSLLRGRAGERLSPGRIEAALDAETLYWSALVGLLDAVRSGTTSVFAWVPVVTDEGVESVSRAFEEVRVRGSLAFAISSRARAATSIDQNLRRIRSCAGSAAEWRHGFFGLDATSEVDPETVGAAVEAAGTQGAGFHVRLGAGGGVPSLFRSGVFRHGGLAVSSGELAPEDVEVLCDSDVFLVHTPQSGGIEGGPPLDLRAAGVKVALGTDGSGLGLLEEFRLASLRQRSLEDPDGELTPSLRLGYHAAFVVNPELATTTFGPELGRIKPGARADLVVLDYRPSTPLDHENVPEHLFWGVARAPVETVIVKGRLLYHNRQFVGLDEERIRARAREAAKKLWERI